MSYYSQLNQVYKDFFKKFDFEPQNDFEANAFLRGIYNLDKHKSLTINLQTPVKKQNKDINKIVANKNNYLDLFYPQVWQQLNVQQKMQAAVFAFNSMIEQDTSIIKERPQLVFICSDISYGGLTYLKNDQNIIDLSMNKYIVYKNSNPLQLLCVLKHEITHCKQNALKNKVIEKIKSNNRRGISNEGLTDFELGLLNEFGQYFFDCNEIAKTINLRHEFCDLKKTNPSDFDLLCSWQKIKNNYDWRLLLSLFYYLDSAEEGAFNKGANFVKSVDNYFASNFENYKKDHSVLSAKEKIEDVLNILNQQYKFNLKPEDIAEFKKINTIMANIQKKDFFGNNQFDQVYVDEPDFFKSAYWVLIKKVLNIYQDKRIAKPISQSLVDKFKKNTINAINEDYSWIINI